MDFYLNINTVLIAQDPFEEIVNYDKYVFLLQQYNLVIHEYVLLKIPYTFLAYNYHNSLKAAVIVSWFFVVDY